MSSKLRKGHTEVLGLLRSKNRCLQRFLDTSMEFLSAAEKGDFANLSAFHERRESIIRVMSLYDRKITETVSMLSEEQTRDSAVVETVRRSLDEKSSLIHQILGIDEKIMACLDKEKAKVLTDIASSSRSREMVGKFKSAWVPEPGEELDKKL